MPRARKNEEFARWWSEWIRRTHLQHDASSPLPPPLTNPLDREDANADSESRNNAEGSHSLLAILCFVLLASVAPAQEHSPGHTWDYGKSQGPNIWGELKPEFAQCKDGHQQSPIDMRNPHKASLRPIEFSYRSSALHIIDNGHTVMVNYDPGSGHLVCPAHGAIFDPASSFSVLQGPATSPLPAVSIHVNSDGTITTG